MNTSPRTRRIAAIFAAALIAVAGLALPAVAKGPKAGHKIHATKGKSVNAKAKGAAKKAAAKARRDARKAARLASYVATGTLVSTDGSTLTVDVTGGNRKALRVAGQVFTLAEGATVSRDDVVVTLADLVAGDEVSVKGTNDGTTLWASKVSATSPPPVEPDPTITDPTTTTDPTETTDPITTTDPTETAP